MPYEHEIECPFCLKRFPYPKKRHYVFMKKWPRGKDTEEIGCGISLSSTLVLTSKPEEVNCLTCLRQVAKGRI